MKGACSHIPNGLAPSLTCHFLSYIEVICSDLENLGWSRIKNQEIVYLSLQVVCFMEWRELHLLVLALIATACCAFAENTSGSGEEGLRARLQGKTPGRQMLLPVSLRVESHDHPPSRLSKWCFRLEKLGGSYVWGALTNIRETMATKVLDFSL